MAIHDREFATPPRSWSDLRWRLQLLAEIHIGSRVRSAQDEEDQVARQMGAKIR